MKNGSSSRHLPREATKYRSRRDAVSNSSNGLSSVQRNIVVAYSDTIDRA
jgi:hypothetical protein